MKPRIFGTPLAHTLRKVSRSLYLSFRVLPDEIRETLALGYLLCRAADSLADTRLLPGQKRLSALEQFRAIFLNQEEGASAAAKIRSEFADRQDLPAERLLLDQFPLCLTLWRESPDPEKSLVRDVVLEVTEGMLTDLRCFSGDTENEIQALPSAEELDRYCGFIGGAPGVFWSRLCLERLEILQDCPIEEKHIWVTQGRDLGKGLQMVNILRDAASDLRIGRCYFPKEELASTGLSPRDLLAPASLARFRPILRHWTQRCLEYLEGAEKYLSRIPVGHWRLRAGVFWPVWIALETLALIAGSEKLLQPQARVKMSRVNLYLALLKSAPGIVSQNELARSTSRLRDRVATQIRPGR